MTYKEFYEFYRGFQEGKFNPHLNRVVDSLDIHLLWKEWDCLTPEEKEDVTEERLIMYLISTLEELEEEQIMKRCPKCGCEEFYVDAHIVETWLVDGNGEYILTKESCVGVAHEPNDYDIWECAKCGYFADGYVFNIKE